MSAPGYRHTHCQKGHLYTPETTYVYPDGRRECRICIKNRTRRYRETNREDLREYQRIWTEGRRRENGVTPLDNNRWRNRKTPRPGSTSNAQAAKDPIQGYDAAPFAAWLTDRQERYSDRREMAAHLGIDRSLLDKLVNGKVGSVSIDTIDRALTSAGEPWLLEEWYPLEVAA